MADSTWQTIGGSIKIPKGWFVIHADFDCDEPYIEICSDLPGHEIETVKLAFPKPVAYYLTTHWCGSEKMHKTITLTAKNLVRNNIIETLGLDRISTALKMENE